MSDVKPRHEMTLRAERARVTRRRIADAARTLFSRHGYGATTITAIAAEAGVAVQTVYAVHRSKAGILRVLREELVNQPEADALFAEALTERDPQRTVALFAASIRARWQAGHDLVAIDAQAAATDPTVRSDMEHVLARRRAGIDRIAQSLGPALAPGLDVPRAKAILDALTMPEVYAELVDVHGWSADAFEVWLAQTLCREILPR